MRKISAWLAFSAALVLIASTLWAAGAAQSEVEDDLMASRRLFGEIGPGLRALRRAANGNYYVLASPSLGVAIFDSKGHRLKVFGAPPEEAGTNKSARALIAFGEDCDVDGAGNVYVADTAYNQVNEFAPDGKPLRSFPANAVLSLAVLPEGEVAVSTREPSHHIIVYGPDGKVAREFGDLESMSSRADINRYLNLGRVAADPQGHLYYGFTYMPEPTVREFERLGGAIQDFVFTGLDAFPEASATRKAIVRYENSSEPLAFHPILTAFGVDPVSGDVWMGLHNTLLHFDKDGIRRSEYQIYTPKGRPLEASVILVEPERLLIGSDPLGIYEFHRPDRKY
ncbi:MAG TPA: hypothetical protein VMU53_16115 [Candidatus Sulfotelmatobacter sp.]|nr:hypothetical protein [Candidatus Sulfotelmatobacter sp.]